MRKLFILLGSPIWLPVLLALYAVVFSVCLSLWVALLALAVTSVAGIPLGVILGVSGNIPAGGFYIGSALVCLVDSVDYLRGFQLRVSHSHSLLAVIKITVDKEPDDVWLISQNVICTSADEHAAVLPRVLLDDLGLKDEELVVERHLISKVHCSSQYV